MGDCVSRALVSNYGSGGDPRNRGTRAVDQPAPTLASKADRNKWADEDTGRKSMSADEAAALQSFPTDWIHARPAPTIVGTRRSEGGMLVGRQLADDSRRDTGGHQTSKGLRDGMLPGVRVSGDQAAALQSFPAGVTFTQNNRQKNQARRNLDEPAPTVTAGHDSGNRGFIDGDHFEVATQEQVASLQSFPASRPAYEPEAAVPGDTSWCERRPSPTIVGSFAPDVVAAPGYRKAGDGPRQSQPGSIRVSQEQAAVLQSFPIEPAFVWKGAKTKQFLQIGNAVPPLLGTHVLESLVFGGQEVAKTYELSNLREDPFSRPEVS